MGFVILWPLKRGVGYNQGQVPHVPSIAVPSNYTPPRRSCSKSSASYVTECQQHEEYHDSSDFEVKHMRINSAVILKSYWPYPSPKAELQTYTLVKQHHETSLSNLQKAPLKLIKSLYNPYMPSYTFMRPYTHLRSPYITRQTRCICTHPLTERL